MATYSNNTTIKFNSRIAVSSTAASGTLYTVPANSYLLIFGVSANSNVISGSASINVQADGFNLISQSGTGSQSAEVVYPGGCIVGAGATITFSCTAGISRGATLRGTLFSNTP